MFFCISSELPWSAVRWPVSLRREKRKNAMPGGTPKATFAVPTIDNEPSHRNLD